MHPTFLECHDALCGLMRKTLMSRYLHRQSFPSLFAGLVYILLMSAGWRNAASDSDGMITDRKLGVLVSRACGVAVFEDCVHRLSQFAPNKTSNTGRKECVWNTMETTPFQCGSRPFAELFALLFVYHGEFCDLDRKQRTFYSQAVY